MKKITLGLMLCMVWSVAFTGRRDSIQVVVFLGVDCPVSQDYMGQLDMMSREYASQGVKFLGVVSRQTARDAYVSFLRDYTVGFDVVADKTGTWTKQLQPHVTPEVFVVDETGDIRYHGAIDNWYYALGRHRQEASEHYLRDAIESLLDGEDPPVPVTTPIGCVLNTASHHK